MICGGLASGWNWVNVMDGCWIFETNNAETEARAEHAKLTPSQKPKQSTKPKTKEPGMTIILQAEKKDRHN